MTTEVRRNHKNKIDFQYNLKSYWQIMKHYKFYIVSILVLTLIIEAADLAGTYLFKIIVDNGTAFVAGTLSKELFIGALLMVLGLFIAFQITSSLCNWFQQRNINKLEVNTIFDLKKKYFNHIMGLSHNFYATHRTGSLISRLSRGGSAVERMTDVFVYNWIPLILQFILVIGTMIFFDLTTAIIVICTAIVFVTYSFILQRLQAPSSVLANTAEDYEKGMVSDIFTNIDSIKYFGKESFIKKKFQGILGKTRDAFFKNWNYSTLMSTGQKTIVGIGTLCVMYFSILKVLDGTMTLGALTFIYTAYIGLIGPLHGFVHGIRGFYRSMADFQDLFEYGKIESEIKDKPDAKEANIKEGVIEFQKVNFNYGKRKIFENFNLKIHKNEKVAFVGHSGSGKTTLVKLLYRLYDVDSGKITIDGKDIRDFKHESLREEMSVVPQECVLFDDTVFNNVLFSRPNATKKEVIDAIRFAQLDKVISKFPKKEQTIVGERGVKLSGGEKQRVSIARAILANKQVLVLDEATSSLDSQTEHDIQEDLKELMKGRTSIVIAHRLSTIMNADKIVVMKDGKIVQIGKHKELIRQQGEYRHLWELQKGGYIK
ncbi:putative ABC transporter ATP-binding protein [uncultured archaeon]|nr:putative ABC transporter ATP-binding protein [uncultured archaeon]